MELLSRPSHELRYRAYFWLMDASAIALIIGAADFLGQGIFGMGFEDFVPAPWIYLIGIPLLFLNFFVPMFLVVARFMRDDYAESLWRRAMLSVGYGVAVGPMVLLAAGWILYLLIGPSVPSWLRPFLDSRAPIQVLLYLWEAHLILFVCSFQFHRWRDTR